MALTITLHPELENILDGYSSHVIEVAFDADYATGGESLTFHQLGVVKTLRSVQIEPSTDGHEFAYDRANQKLLAFSNGVQVALHTDLHLLTNVRIVAQEE